MKSNYIPERQKRLPKRFSKGKFPLMQTNEFLLFLKDAFPPLALLALLSTFLFALLGWILSIRAGFKSEKGGRLRPCLIFPLTNPLALLVLLAMRFKTGLPALLCYLLALLALPLGGQLAQWLENAKLSQYEAELQNRGETLWLDSLKPSPVPEASNIWMHPFLKPLALAGQSTAEGETVREEIRKTDADGYSPYKTFSAPKRFDGLHYPDTPKENPSFSAETTLQAVHKIALDALALQDGAVAETKVPSSWGEVAALILDYYQPAEEAARQLEEAVRREYDQYPYDWKQLQHMLLPHLAYLKRFTQFAYYRSAACAMNGDAEEAFRMLRLGFQFAQTGDSDILIFRLVQMAQVRIILNGVHIAQQFHIGNDAQWQSLAEALHQWNFPALVPNSLRAERAFGHAIIAPLTKMSFHKARRQIEIIGNESSPMPSDLAGSTFFQSVFDLWTGGGIRALNLRNWTMALAAYEEMITNTEKTLEKSRSDPWNQCKVPALKQPLWAYGIFAQMLLPALEKTFEKAMQTQHHVELAKVAIALERFYLAHQSYPETLAALSPDWLPSPPMDPMTRKPWQYQRLETTRFLLYSVGKNGIDNGGVQPRKKDTNAKDDLGWRILPTVPELPKVAAN